MVGVDDKGALRDDIFNDGEFGFTLTDQTTDLLIKVEPPWFYDYLNGNYQDPNILLRSSDLRCEATKFLINEKMVDHLVPTAQAPAGAANLYPSQTFRDLDPFPCELGWSFNSYSTLASISILTLLMSFLFIH